MTKTEDIERAIQLLEEAVERTEKKQYWSAYDSVRRARDLLYLAESGLAHKSPRAALHWGCGVRMPDKTIAIIEYGA